MTAAIESLRRIATEALLDHHLVEALDMLRLIHGGRWRVTIDHDRRVVVIRQIGEE